MSHSHIRFSDASPGFFYSDHILWVRDFLLFLTFQEVRTRSQLFNYPGFTWCFIFQLSISSINISQELESQKLYKSHQEKQSRAILLTSTYNLPFFFFFNNVASDLSQKPQFESHL